MQEPLLSPSSPLGRLSALPKGLEWFFLLLAANGLSPKTMTAYAVALRDLLAFCQRQGFPSDPLQLTPDHLRAWIVHLRSRNLSSYSVHTYVRTLKGFYSHAVKEGKLKPSRNPFAKLPVPKAPRVMPALYTPDALQKMLFLCPPNTPWGARDRAILFCFLYTGLRLSELASIRLADLDLRQGTLKVMGKGGKERLVGLHPEVVQALLRWLAFRPAEAPHEYLWTAIGALSPKPATAHAIALMVRRLQRRAGVKVPRAVHAFRHTFAVYSLLDGKLPRRLLQEVLGHSTDAATRLYEEGLARFSAASAHRLLPLYQGWGLSGPPLELRRRPGKGLS